MKTEISQLEIVLSHNDTRSGTETQKHDEYINKMKTTDDSNKTKVP